MLVACAYPGGPATPYPTYTPLPSYTPYPSPQVTLHIVDDFFQESDIVVVKGTVVTWVNDGENPHTSTSAEASRERWDTGILNGRARGTHTFGAAAAAESVYSTTNTRMLQLLAPERLHGSMSGILQLSFLGIPVGGLLAGAAAYKLGAPFVGTAITLTSFAIGLSVLLASPRMRGLRRSRLGQREGAPAEAVR